MHAMFPLVLAGVMAAGAFDAVSAVQLPEGRPIAARDNEAKQTATESPLKRLARLELRATPLKQALEQLHLRSGVNLIYSPTRIPDVMVSCSCREHTVEEALTHMFARVPLSFDVADSDVIIVPVIATQAAAAAEPAVSPVQRVAQVQPAGAAVVERTRAKRVVGTISGRAIDAASGQGIAGVSVMLEGTRIGALTTAGGGFRIPGVPTGTHKVAAIMLGYAAKTQEVTVEDGSTVELMFALEREAIALDEVVVTGSMVETRVRELSSPITVLTSSEIEKLAITRADQLFRGTVAGATSFDGGPLNYAGSVRMRGANALGEDYIKTYIDGVEITRHSFISTIDPENIERVEILRGPQATTIYGAGASGGVMQIFTKKGRQSARPIITVSSAAGLIDGRWNDGDAVAQTDNSLTVSGGGEEYSYNLGMSHLWMDSYVPHSRTKNFSSFGTLRIQQGPLQATLMGRWYRKDFLWPQNPIFRDLGFAPYQNPTYEQDFVHQKSVGLDLSYALRSNWTHNLTLGFDANQFEYYNYRPRLTTPADTFVTVSYAPAERLSARYNTSVQFYVTSNVSATLVGGVDYSQHRQGGFNNPVATRPWVNVVGAGATLYHTRDASTGYFIQGHFGLMDRLFLTTGVRTEVSESLGDEYGNAVAPRVGLAYSFDVGDIGVKTRGAWGKGIKLPNPQFRTGSNFASFRIAPNEGIGPEEIVGWDAGIELQFSDRASLGITYYDQLAKGLIENVLLDPSEPTMPIYQYQNAGEIANSGWEVEGEVYLRPLPITLRGTFTTMKSIMEKRAPGYSGDIQIGESMLSIPEYSGGLTVTYSHTKGAVSLSTTHIGPWKYYDTVALYGYYYNGEPYRGSDRDYWIRYDGVTKLGVNATYSLASAIEAYLRVDNLTNNTGNEDHNSNTDLPRSFMLGLRVTR